jgi:hypothetical protein
MSAFEQFVRDFTEWVVIFARSPIDIVSETYSKMVGGEIEQNISLDFTLQTKEQYPPTGSIVRIADSDWTIIFHQVGVWSEFNTKRLSKKLNSKILEFSGEDTSGVVGCTLFDPDLDAPIEYATADDSEYLDELYEDVMEQAQELDPEDFPQLVNNSNIVKSYDDLFNSLGIKTVRVYLNQSRDLAIIEDKQMQVERIDILKGISCEY